MSKLKTLKYIFIKYEERKRKIYLNVEKIPVIATDNATSCEVEVAENCDHNIKNKYKSEYNNYTNYRNNHRKEIVPIWMEHPEMCKKEEASPEEIAELEEMLKKFE